MNNWIKESWREIVGWIVIICFVYLYLFKINQMPIFTHRDKAFDFLAVLTILILAWLTLNKSIKHEK